MSDHAVASLRIGVGDWHVRAQRRELHRSAGRINPQRSAACGNTLSALHWRKCERSLCSRSGEKVVMVPVPSSSARAHRSRSCRRGRGRGGVLRESGAKCEDAAAPAANNFVNVFCFMFVLWFVERMVSVVPISDFVPAGLYSPPVRKAIESRLHR